MKMKVSPMQERLGVSGTNVLSETELADSPESELLPDAELLVQVTSEPPLWTSSTSRFVLAMELTNRNTLCGVGEDVFCLNLWWVPLVISSIAFAIASAKDEVTWSTQMPAETLILYNKHCWSVGYHLLLRDSRPHVIIQYIWWYTSVQLSLADCCTQLCDSAPSSKIFFWWESSIAP
jgi:hypothetical protein